MLFQTRNFVNTIYFVHNSFLKLLQSLQKLWNFNIQSESSWSKFLYNMTLTLFVLPLKDINYELSIINLSQIVIMNVLCCYNLLVFISLAILLLIDFTNFAKADSYADKDYNYDRYQYPDYQSSTYNSLSCLYKLFLLPFLRSFCSCGLWI